MKDLIFETVKNFLINTWKPGKPILLGYSGGIDSTCLLYVLIKCLEKLPIDLHIAHLDHGWRRESSEQAHMLEEQIRQLGLPFYTSKVPSFKKENVARAQRFLFFQELYKSLDCQALVLGHQADDQSETILKRVLEGASLSALKGMMPISEFEGMVLWRPLLEIQKIYLKKWLENRGKWWIDDYTNRDSAYLRARMRTTILPDLNQKFGKQVDGNLRKLGNLAQEMTIYLDKHIKKFYHLIKETEIEVTVDLSSEFPFEPIELKVFLKQFAEKYGIFLSYEAIQTLYLLIEKGVCNRKVGSKQGFIEVHGRCIAIKKQ